MIPQPPALLSWDFENAMSERGVSTAVGVPSDPSAISGFVSQTGGGPVEVFGDVGTVFLTRHLGTNDVFLWFTVTRTVFFAGLTFRHWHNHNPGYPTHPSYQVQLQLDSGDGYEKVGVPLELSNANSGGTDTIDVGRELPPGSYKLRWHPKGLGKKARDTSSEFLAFKNLTLTGRVSELFPTTAPKVEIPAPCATPGAAPSAPPSFITVAIAGVTVERLKVMESKFPGVCVRSGAAFDSGTLIGFKHRNTLTDEQRLAIFGAGKTGHITVVLTPEEANTPRPEATGDEEDEDGE